MLKKLIPHICITLALFTVTYTILNEFNPVFFNKPFFKVTLLVFCVASIVAAAFMISDERKR
jgi:uncharacterized membrane protein